MVVALDSVGATLSPSGEASNSCAVQVHEYGAAPKAHRARLDLRDRSGGAHIRVAFEQRAECDTGLEAGKVRAEAEVQPPAETELRIGIAREVYPAGFGDDRWIVIRRDDPEKDVLAGLELLSAALVGFRDLARHAAGGSADAHKLLDRAGRDFGVLAQLLDQVGPFEKDGQCIAEECRGGFVAAEEDERAGANELDFAEGANFGVHDGRKDRTRGRATFALDQLPEECNELLSCAADW